MNADRKSKPQQNRGKSKANKVSDSNIKRKQAEELRESEELHRIILSSISDAVFITDNQGKFVYICLNVQVIFGYSQVEVTAFGNIEKLLGADLFDSKELNTRKEIQNIERRIITKNGVHRNLLVNVKSISIRNGRVLYTCRDITERKQTEEALQEAEIKYRMLVERLPVAIYTSELGTNGKWHYISPQIKYLLGFTANEWLSEPTLWYRQVHPDDRDRQLMLEEQAWAQKESFEGEYRIFTRDGRLIWIRDSAQILPPQNNSAPIVQGVLMDITERKRAEEELSLSKAQLLANLNNTPNVAIQWYNKDGYILYWNPASESMYGWKSLDTIGKTLVELIHTPEEQAEFMRILAEVQETGKPFGPYEARIRRRDGAIGWVVATTFSIPMNDGQIGFVCMDVDITERKQAEEKIRRQLDYLTALQDIDRTIASTFDLSLSLDTLISKAIPLLAVDAVAVLLINYDANTLEFVAGDGFQTNAIKTTNITLGESYAGRAAIKQHIVKIPNLKDEPDNLFITGFLEREGFISYYGVPLIVKEKVIGVLEVFQRSLIKRDQEWLDFLNALAGQAAIAIDNAQLFEGMQRSNLELSLAYDATIEGWSAALDLRDKETEGHSQRVTEMTIKLARRMDIAESELIQMRRGVLLHDIGKLGIPDHILLKPGKLTDQEWEIMQKHPVYAYNMLSSISYLKYALDIPYCHHEKWDGTGYPRGLKNEGIPLAARIFAIVDVWDALTSDRPYRLAWTHQRTLEYIKEQSGTHFDPQVVESFLKLLNDK